MSSVANGARAIGAVIAIGFMGLSGAINWRYGIHLGRDGADQIIYATASVFADIGKAAAPFLFFYSIGARRWAPAAAAVIFWISCSGYSLASLAGFMESNATDRANIMETRHTNRLADVVMLAAKSRARETLGAVDAPAITTTRAARAKLDRRWLTSKSCSDARTAAERKFCDEILALDTEYAKGVEADRLDREMAGLRDRISTDGGGAHAAHSDPRVSFVARHLGIANTAAEAIFALLFMSVVEIGSGLGLFMAIGHGAQGARNGRAATDEVPLAVGRDTTRVLASGGDKVLSGTQSGSTGKEGSGPTIGNVAKFARAKLIAAPGRSVAIADLYTNYAVWCGTIGHSVTDRATFDRDVEEIAAAVGLKSVCAGNAMVLRETVLES